MVVHEWSCLSGLSVDEFQDLPIQFGHVLTAKNVNGGCILLVGLGGPTLIKKSIKWESGLFPCHGMAELPRILFGHERGKLRSTRLALIEWLKRGLRKWFLARYSGVDVVCAVNLDFGFLNKFLIIEKFATKLCFHFALILVSKKRYNDVNRRITIFISADYLSSYCKSQALHLYAISAFKISSYYFIKVCLLRLFLFFKGFSAYVKNTFSVPAPLLCMIFAEITFCPSINLEQPVMVLVLFFLTYQLSCGMR